MTDVADVNPDVSDLTPLPPTFVRYTPEGYPDPPTTIVETLEQAKTVLVREGTWCRSTWFYNQHPEVNPDDPFCNSWKVCAEGAVGIVTYGVKSNRKAFDQDLSNEAWTYDTGSSDVYTSDEYQLYKKALRLLLRAGQATFGMSRDAANSYNDAVVANRGEVTAWFDVAIAVAKADEITGRDHNGVAPGQYGYGRIN
jgi:hypothetical protein